MHCSASTIPYSETGFFSVLVTDYVAADTKLQMLYEHPVSTAGFLAAIQQRNNFNTNRQLLVQVLQKQYANIQLTTKQQHNIQSLLLPNTYSITTAHQPNIFTGHLYFVYKILHAIKIAQELSVQMPENNFVPVYYMGSEDADLDELGHIYLDGIRYQWQTPQTGAVGRMLVDQSLIDVIKTISGQLLVHPFGPQIVQTIAECYTLGNTIEQATFLLVNQLFAEYGLLVVLPDNADLKASFNKVLVKELVEQFSHKKVEETAQIFPPVYKAKMSGRPLNLFYLQQNSRNRIEWDGKVFTVVDTDLVFTKEQILDEVYQFPERFSPNVILRPVFQEWILPNIAFVGGGGEIAYWLTLKKVFEDVAVPYPMLILRNSFMVIENKYQQAIEKLQLSIQDLFQSTLSIQNQYAQKNSSVIVSIAAEQLALQNLYKQIGGIAGNIDITLANHTEALLVKANKKLADLEKKMLKAARNKNETANRQIAHLKKQLFPANNLQERVENIMLLYAKYGPELIGQLYQHAGTIQQHFTVLKLL